MVKKFFLILVIFVVLKKSFGVNNFFGNKSKVISINQMTLDSLFLKLKIVDLDTILSVKSKFEHLVSIKNKWDKVVIEISNRHFSKSSVYKIDSTNLDEIYYVGSKNNFYHLFLIKQKDINGAHITKLLMLSTNRQKKIICSSIVSMSLFFSQEICYNSFFLKPNEIISDNNFTNSTNNLRPKTIYGKINNYNLKRRKIILKKNGRMRSKFVFYKKYPKMKIIF
jgi:hypothetical protein